MVVSTKRNYVSKYKSKILSKLNKVTSSRKHLIKSRQSGTKTKKMSGGWGWRNKKVKTQTELDKEKIHKNKRNARKLTKMINQGKYVSEQAKRNLMVYYANLEVIKSHGNVEIKPVQVRLFNIKPTTGALQSMMTLPGTRVGEPVEGTVKLSMLTPKSVKQKKTPAEAKRDLNNNITLLSIKKNLEDKKKLYNTLGTKVVYNSEHGKKIKIFKDKIEAYIERINNIHTNRNRNRNNNNNRLVQNTYSQLHSKHNQNKSYQKKTNSHNLFINPNPNITPIEYKILIDKETDLLQFLGEEIKKFDNL